MNPFYKPSPITIVSIFSVCILVGGIIMYRVKGTPQVQPPIVSTSSSTSPDVKNLTYSIGEESFTLVNGAATKDIVPGSATKNTLNIFSEPVYGDLNGDGTLDAALTLVNNPGGSGAFYYAVLALKHGDTYTPTNALLLGDRIAPQPTTITNGRAIYNYAERKAGEPMTTQPSIGKSLYVHYSSTTNEIGELVNNFEGEANPGTMTLLMKKWTWVKTQMNDGTVTVPKKPAAFTLTFTKDSKLNVTTDCNSMGGSYVMKGNSLTFSQLMSTKMFCEGSQEEVFAASLGEVASYLFTSKGELVLEIKMDSGTMTFK